ncbi:uncharacterized protein LOC131207952 [Anopheles bellator]|uniref:uncharacterized protein LOC131207952 n=1 Tax=Anopheles bellator TaxID=139047 RepID=UPI002647AF23|nr:uncharacterized protein LOC131207952 [Anopheles bellator]
MATSGFIRLTLIVVIGGASLGHALRCYQCNSNDNSECRAPPKSFNESEYGDNRTVVGRLLKECPRDDEGRDPFCRSMFVLVLGGKNQPDHTRILRECGYVRHHRPCYSVENGGHEEVVCQCPTDGCNGSAQHSASIVALLSAGVVLRLLTAPF